MWRALQITWRIAWRTIELAIVVYVLSAISDRNTSLIVSALGLIYATIRSSFLNLAMGLLPMPVGVDQQLYELRRLRDEAHGLPMPMPSKPVSTSTRSSLGRSSRCST